jgi:hypothetical protein
MSIKQFKDNLCYLFVLGDRAAKVSFILFLSIFLSYTNNFFLGIFALLAQLDRAQDF